MVTSMFYAFSTVTSWGKDSEADAYRNMLTQYPTGLVAVVSDSYDIWTACDELWGNQLKSQIEKRDGTLVVRPDSGVPHEVVIRVRILGLCLLYDLILFLQLSLIVPNRCWKYWALGLVSKSTPKATRFCLTASG